MTRPRMFQDAGAERRLDAGQCYELPDVVATALVATGAAIRVQLDAEPAAPWQDDMRPPEGQNLAAPERKRARP